METIIRKHWWVCNECNMYNFTDAVPESEIKEELHACINCGGFEFHLEPPKEITQFTLTEADLIDLIILSRGMSKPANEVLSFWLKSNKLNK